MKTLRIIEDDFSDIEGSFDQGVYSGGANEMGVSGQDSQRSPKHRSKSPVGKN